MTLPFAFDSAARDEFYAAIDWYEKQKAGLGDRFVDSIRTLIERICEQPEMFAVVEQDVRQAIVERSFPYSILYRIHNHRVLIIAIFHSSRDPQVWKRRV